jgi:DNA polymerase (family 10)
MAIEEATERVLTAIRNPYTSILGHPTGRILLVREGYPLDYARVLDACAAHDVAVELNANPYRLDLDWRWVREATQRGILISINPDAHAMEGLRDTYWGVEAARKGWLTADQCLNALPLEAFEAWLDKQKQKRQA